MELIETLAVENILGEGVIWDADAQKLLWLDIQGRQLYRYDLVAQQLEQWETPERLCCMAPTATPNRLAVAFESGFAFYQPLNDQVEWITKLEADNPGTRFNDGRTDRQGRLWAGTMVENENAASYQGSLYCLHADLSVTKSIGGLSITNSLCWSPDGHTVYHTDTPTQEINAYSFDAAKATWGEPRLLVKTEPGCFPDGSIVDSQGYIWNAQWGGHKVVRYSPNGEQDLVLEVPTEQPSCVAFGGVDLSLLAVSSAHQDMSAEQRSKDQQAGSLFIYQTPFTGLRESIFIEA